MNMAQAWDRENSEKILSPWQESNPWHPNTWRVLYPLSYENSCVREGMGSILTGDSEFFFSLTRVMLINSHFITELKIHHHYSLITTRDDLDSADPTRMQDACHLWTQLNDHALPVAQWIAHVFRRSWVWFLLGSQNFLFLSHTLVMLTSRFIPKQ